MTLKQRLNDSIITNINIVESENRMCYDYNHLELAEECEKIADEFAIGFAEWLVSNCYCEDDQQWWLIRDLGDIKKSSSELLEIYKKEKDNEAIHKTM